MKNEILVLAFCFSTVATFAQHNHSTHQNMVSTTTTDTGRQYNLSQLLASYYSIKDALVAGNAASASAGADQFIKVANTVDYKVISEGNINALLKDANKIAAGRDINKQREVFASLSANMATVAKTVRLSAAPVYLQYCPMKKASWLSSEAAIKNPYYGKQMLTCGNVTETINPVASQN